MVGLPRLSGCFVGSVLKGAVALAAVFALTTAGLFFLQLRRTTAGLAVTLTAIQKDADDIKVMTNATLFQAEEVLHHTDVLVATETKAQTQQLSRLAAVVTQLQETVRTVTESTNQALNGLPAVTTQLQATLAETQRTVAKTGEAVTALNKLETDLDPTVRNMNETTSHMSNMSAALDKVVQDATKPKPWYRKIWGYAWAPIKLAAVFAR